MIGVVVLRVACGCWVLSVGVCCEGCEGCRFCSLCSISPLFYCSVVIVFSSSSSCSSPFFFLISVCFVGALWTKALWHRKEGERQRNEKRDEQKGTLILWYVAANDLKNPGLVVNPQDSGIVQMQSYQVRSSFPPLCLHVLFFLIVAPTFDLFFASWRLSFRLWSKLSLSMHWEVITLLWVVDTINAFQ